MSGGIYRSEILNYYKLQIPRESKWITINEIAQMSLVHFDTDHSKEQNAIDRPFLDQLRRIETTESQLEALYTKIQQYQQLQLIEPEGKQEMEQAIKQQQLDCEQSFVALETQIQEKLASISTQEEFMKQQEQQWEYYEDKIEIIKLMKKTFEKDEIENNNMEEESFQGDEQSKLIDRSVDSSKLRLDCVCGIIPKESLNQFSRLVFRITKTQYIMVAKEFESKNQSRIVFLIYFVGGVHNVIKQKLIRAASNFSSSNYQNLCNVNPEKYPQKLEQFNQKLEELKISMKSTLNAIQIAISDLTTPVPSHSFSTYYLHYYLLHKHKQIFSILSTFILQQQIIVSYCYLPQSQEIEVMKTLYELQRQTKSTAVGQLFAWQIPKGSVIPSKFKTFEWLANTMEIVHTYGVPRYQELTPTVWTFATFPFFVGIMFGDIAHGMIVLALSLYLYTQGYKPNNPLSQLYPYRLLILMIGISAVFCGFMYNEFLGLNAGFFGSCYNSTTGDRIKGCELPFGLDPIWAMSDNHIAFVNSLKMKLSIIFGVVQIILGIILKGFNDYFFEKWVTFFADFVPQLVFFLALFGFMVVVIFVKWMTPFPDPSESYSILTIFISTPLDKLLVIILTVKFNQFFPRKARTNSQN